jgi:hypothetical protein
MKWITYIFDNLLGAPPVTLATLKRASSALSSFNCNTRTREHADMSAHQMKNYVMQKGSEHFTNTLNPNLDQLN